MASTLQQRKPQKDDDDISVNPDAEVSFGSGSGSVATDEDDFATLRAVNIGEMYDDQFKHFSKWIRNHYAKKYPRSKMREMNYHSCLKFVGAVMMSVAMYFVLFKYFHDYVRIWFVPFWLFNLFFVVSKEEIVHARAHWTTNMTGSWFLDKMVDWSMMAFTGASKESFRRRHIAAHYADIGNIARVFSDVWLPFVTLPPTFYLSPHRLIMIFLDVEYCKKERLSRSQLFIEMIGLWSYIFAAAYELYHGSFYLISFHFTPMLYFHASVFLSATVCHSGVDKRNSFDSNGLFDHETCKGPTGLFQICAYMLAYVGDYTLQNHGIHHAFTQLPLEVVNRDYKLLNKFCIETYKDVRYNDTLTLRMHANIWKRLPPPKWYDWVIQFFVVNCVFGLTALTVLGFNVAPVIWEPFLIDYRFYLYSTKSERYKNQLALWEMMELPTRAKEPQYANANAYFWMMVKTVDYMKTYLDKNEPGWKPAKLGPIMSDDVYDLMVVRRGKMN